VYVILTPSAYRWLSEDAASVIRPRARVSLIAAAHFVSVLFGERGHEDRVRAGIGLGLPITALSRFNDARPRTLPWRATSPLHEAGVTVLLEEGDFAPHKPKNPAGSPAAVGAPSNVEAPTSSPQGLLPHTPVAPGPECSLWSATTRSPEDYRRVLTMPACARHFSTRWT